MKPIWLTEVGCPAIDKGANEPNVFVDAKSAESARPRFSSGARDDLMQRRYLQAVHEAFDPASAGYVAGANPVSAAYGGRMLPPQRITAYTWDARPFPAFPGDTDAWGDAGNWPHGHWLNGRLAAAPLAETVAAILDDYGFAEHDTSALNGLVGGVVIDRIMPAREALQPLELSQFFDAIESGGAIRFVHRGAQGPVATLTAEDLVEVKPEAALYELTRQQETELPASAKISYLAADADYRQSVAEARRATSASERVATADLALVMEQPQAAAIAEAWLWDTWAARERAAFSLPPSRLAIEPADTVLLDVEGRERLLRLTEVGDAGRREMLALGIDPEIYPAADHAARRSALPTPQVYGQPALAFLDLPLLRGDEVAHAGWVAAFQSPWPGAVAVYRSAEASGYTLNVRIEAAAITGITTTALAGAPAWRWDKAGTVTVRLDGGSLASASELALLEGANLAAIETVAGIWELVQFESAELVGERTYRLSRLLRGQAGSESAIAGSVPAGARFVLIGRGVTQVAMGAGDVGRAFYWRYGPAPREIGDASYATAAHAFAGLGLRPLSPVHVRGRRAAGGDLTLSWVRRTRMGGDSWEAAEAPLAEESERYEVDIVSGSSVVRTLAASTPAVIYAAAQQIADFGTVQGSVAVRIVQLSAVYGRGIATAAVV
jgi:hypothetical protein